VGKHDAPVAPTVVERRSVHEGKTAAPVLSVSNITVDIPQRNVADALDRAWTVVEVDLVAFVGLKKAADSYENRTLRLSDDDRVLVVSPKNVGTTPA
jgi:hypothetical protein